MTRVIQVAILMLASSSAALGQDSASRVGAPTDRGCFPGAPLPRCRSFWITEASYVARLTGAGDPYSSHPTGLSASLEVGRMRNVSPRVALGASVSAHLIDGVALGIRSRIRYWLGPQTSLDFAPGLLVAGVAGSPRFTADVSVMSHDRVGLTLQSFVLPAPQYYPDGTTVPGSRLVLYGGVKLGSKLGLIGAGADVVGLLAVIASFVIVCSNNGCD